LVCFASGCCLPGNWGVGGGVRVWDLRPQPVYEPPINRPLRSIPLPRTDEVPEERLLPPEPVQPRSSGLEKSPEVIPDLKKPAAKPIRPAPVKAEWKGPTGAIA